MKNWYIQHEFLITAYSALAVVAVVSSIVGYKISNHKEN